MPYGIAANDTPLDALFQYSYEQGLASKRRTYVELFHLPAFELAKP